MKLIKRILTALLVIFFLLTMTGFFYVRHLARKGIPDYETDIRLSGLTAEVEVIRDQRGVPHIYGRNEADLYRAVGYVMSQDRLWQMDLLRRVTAGRLSEIFGEDLVESDLLMRALRIPEKSAMVFAAAEPKPAAALAAFADGVNLYIQSHLSKLPLEFSLLGYKPEPWRPEHCLNLIGYMGWDLAGGWSEEIIFDKIAQLYGGDREKIRDLIPDYSHQRGVVFETLTAPAGEMGTPLLRAFEGIEELGLVLSHGSNNWAVSGAKSESGYPMLANDMHLRLWSPGIWYQMHQVIPGELDVTGVAVPGQPAVICGHNNRIAWGMTNTMVDNVDFNGQWRDMEVRREVFLTKGGVSVERELRFTHRGPIVSDFRGVEGKALSMRWSGNDFSDELRSVYFVNRASDWETFRDAMRTFGAVSENVVYADREGNIGLCCCAGIPLRQGDGLAIHPGDTDAFDWKGYVPFDELPHVFNPPGGMVSSANNRTAAESWPVYVGTLFETEGRIGRIREMLTRGDKLSRRDFQKMQADIRLNDMDEIWTDVLAVFNGRGAGGEGGGALLQMLNSWDREVAKESAPAAFFEVFILKLAAGIFEDEMGGDLYREFCGNSRLLHHALKNMFANRDSLWWDDRDTVEIREAPEDIILRGFDLALDELEERLGRNPRKWRWGDLHTLTLRHPMGSVKILNRLFRLNRGPFPASGSFHTLCPYRFPLDDPFDSDYGPSQRHVYDLADWDLSLAVIPTGTSGVPASRYYCDQTESYLRNTYFPDAFSRSAVEAAAVFRMTLRPLQDNPPD
jgi:penicillin amidase